MGAGDHSIKLSISYALSQSTKLCVFEERVLEIVASTKDLPESLASTGERFSPLSLYYCQCHCYTSPGFVQFCYWVTLSLAGVLLSMQAR